MSYNMIKARLKRLEKNPFFNLSDEDEELLATYRQKRYVNNPKFSKHDARLKKEPKKKNGKATN